MCVLGDIANWRCRIIIKLQGNECQPNDARLSFADGDSAANLFVSRFFIELLRPQSIPTQIGSPTVEARSRVEVCANGKITAAVDSAARLPNDVHACLHCLGPCDGRIPMYCPSISFRSARRIRPEIVRAIAFPDFAALDRGSPFGLVGARILRKSQTAYRQTQK